MSKALRYILSGGHPYKHSPIRPIYEEIAKICGTTPDRVYKIAHGARLSSFEDEAIVAELMSRGIIQ